MKLMLARDLLDGTKRKGFTAKQRRQVFDANDGICCGCDEPLTDVWHIDHIIPLALNGEHAPANWQAMCEACHSLKTKLDVARIAKSKRQRRLVEDVEPSKRPVKSRGFQGWRKFNGQIVRKADA